MNSCVYGSVTSAKSIVCNTAATLGSVVLCCALGLDCLSFCLSLLLSVYVCVSL